MTVRVKICCIETVDAAREAISAGAAALGLVSAMPSGPGVIDGATIRRIAAVVPPPVTAFLLTSSTGAPAIVAEARAAGTGAVQLVDSVDPDVYAALRRELPNLRIVQVIHVEDSGAIDQAQACAPDVDALLLDSGRTKLAVRELGGTGRTHDWDISRRIVRTVDKPVFLAGGLHAGNVAAAIAAVRPFGVDLCSGVRSDGMLDRAKLGALMAAVAAAA